MDAGTMAVGQWLVPQRFLIDVPVRDPAHALALIAEAVGAEHGLEAAPLARALARRERAGSTGMGGGFAIPHASIAGIDRPVTVFLRAASGVGFRAPDRCPVKDFLAILVPADGDRQVHLALLARVSLLFSDPPFRTVLAGAADAATAAAVFRLGLARTAAAR